MKTHRTTTTTDRFKASFSLLILISLFLPSQASTDPTEDLWVPPRAAQAAQALSADFKLSTRLHANTTQQRGRRQIQLDRLTEQEFRQKIAQTHKGRTKVGFDREIADFLTPAKTHDNLIWQTTPEGGLITLPSFSSPNALALRLGLSVRQLPSTAELRFFKDQNSDADVVTGSEILNLINRNLRAGDPEDTARLYWSPEQDGDAIGVEIYLQPGTSQTRWEIPAA
jgi:hypothetical protein